MRDGTKGIKAFDGVSGVESDLYGYVYYGGVKPGSSKGRTCTIIFASMSGSTLAGWRTPIPTPYSFTTLALTS